MGNAFGSEQELTEFSAKLDKLEESDSDGKALKEIFHDLAVVTSEELTLESPPTARACSSVDEYCAGILEARTPDQKVAIHRSVLAAGLSPDKSSGFVTVKCIREVSKTGSADKISFVINQTFFLRRVKGELKIIALSNDLVKAPPNEPRSADSGPANKH